MVFGDFDGDGNDELVTATGGNTTVKVFDVTSDGRHGAQLYAFSGFPRGGVARDRGPERQRRRRAGGRQRPGHRHGAGPGRHQPVGPADRHHQLLHRQQPGPRRPGRRRQLRQQRRRGCRLRTRARRGRPDQRAAQRGRRPPDRRQPDHRDLPRLQRRVQQRGVVVGGHAGERGSNGASLVVAAESGAKRARRWNDSDADHLLADNLQEQFFPYGSGYTGGIRVRCRRPRQQRHVPGADGRPRHECAGDQGAARPGRRHHPEPLRRGTRIQEFTPFAGITGGVHVAAGKQRTDTYRALGVPTGIADTSTTTVEYNVPASAGLVRDLDVGPRDRPFVHRRPRREHQPRPGRLSSCSPTSAGRTTGSSSG